MSTATTKPDTGFQPGLGTFDSTMMVAGSMIGSGIYIVSADMSRLLGSPGWLLLAWLLTGLLTVTGALSYGELAGMMPKAGGQYVYLRESFSPIWGFLYGWTLLLVIQTGTIAAVGVAFGRFLGILWPAIGEGKYIIEPFHITSGFALSLSTAQLVGVLVIAFLTWTNCQGLRYGKWIQNVFTTAKLGTMVALIFIGIFLAWNSQAVSANFGNLWTPRGFDDVVPGLNALSGFGLFVALCVSQTGSLFSADAWNNITFTAGEVKDPKKNIPLSLALGTAIVITAYLLCNVAYLVALPLEGIQRAPSDRVATAMLQTVFPGLGVSIMAVAIMVSTFGCMNGLVLSGARAYYAMAKDKLFFDQAGVLNKAGVPAWALVLQGIWAAFLVLPRTYDSVAKTYGNLYGTLLDYVISAALIFYILTIAGVFRLRSTRPNVERPYKAFGYPVIPAMYILGASAILIVLFIYRPTTTFAGLGIVLSGVPAYYFLERRGR